MEENPIKSGRWELEGQSNPLFRIGLIEEVTTVLVKYGGNVETSRMARLGGELVEESDLAAFEKEFLVLREEGFQVILVGRKMTTNRNMVRSPSHCYLVFSAKAS